MGRILLVGFDTTWNAFCIWNHFFQMFEIALPNLNTAMLKYTYWRDDGREEMWDG